MVVAKYSNPAAGAPHEGASPGPSPLVETLDAINETIHQKVRLGIMSALVARGDCDFRFLKDTLSVTDGNLSIHLARLEEAGYLSVHKEFVKKKPHTTYTPTRKGREAFASYLAVLERIVQSAGAHHSPDPSGTDSEKGAGGASR
jgi:DNA-binding HxlR family transcriptional regulator